MSCMRTVFKSSSRRSSTVAERPFDEGSSQYWRIRREFGDRPPGSAWMVRTVAAGSRCTPSTMVSGAHAEAVPEVGRHGCGVEPARHRSAGQERADLGGEEHGLLAGVALSDDRPVERLDAHGVPHEMDRTGAGVPEGQGEDPAEAHDRIDAPALVRPEDDLRVAGGAEGLALGLEIATDFAEVVDLPVEGDGAPGVAVHHRLRARFAQVQDGEPPMTEDDLVPA